VKSYYRVMLGRRSIHAKGCFDGSFIGVDYDIREDLSGKLPDDWRAFNHAFIPIYLAAQPGKSKIAAGLACGALWTVSKGIKVGDVVLSPSGSDNCRVGEVTGDYFYQPDGVLPHRRPVHWLSQSINRADMSEALKTSIWVIGTVRNVTQYQNEIERLIGGSESPLTTDKTIEDPASFAMEKHLEDFLVQNWAQTELSKQYDIYEDEGERVGQQYLTDTGAIDILAVSKDKRSLLVIELKKGRASDVVVGQTLRYMGYVQDELAEDNQTVKGVIIALEDDQRIRRALAMTPNIAFYRYQVSFKLVKTQSMTG